MKRLFLVIGSLAALAAPLGTQAATTVTKQPLDLTLPCNGDPVHLAGTLLATDSLTTTPSGGQLIAYHLTAQRVTATDLVTGAVFRADAGVERDLIINSPPGGSTETFVQEIRFVSPGAVFTITDLVHITVTPDGKVRVAFDNFSATCF